MAKQPAVEERRPPPALESRHQHAARRDVGLVVHRDAGGLHPRITVESGVDSNGMSSETII